MLEKKILLVALGGAFAAQAAYAETYDGESYEYPSMYSYRWSEPSMYSGIGVGFIAAGGVAGFTGSTMRDTVDSDVGGLWSARVTIGSHIPIGVDVSYVGTAVDITPLGAVDSGTLIGSAVEGAVRWNILPHYTWNPYLFLGAGWQNYNVTNADFSRAATGVNDSDNLAVFPMGAGVAYRDPTGITFEVRGTFRAAEDSNLVLQSDGNNANLDSWEASAALGYEL